MSKEWNIGQHKGWYDEQKKVFYLKIKKDFVGSDARELRMVLAEVFEGQTEGRHTLIILDHTMSVMKMGKEGRDALKKEFMNPEFPTVDKYAVVGASPSLRMLAKMLMRLSGVKNNAFFKTEDEALAWFNT